MVGAPIGDVPNPPGAVAADIRPLMRAADMAGLFDGESDCNAFGNPPGKIELDVEGKLWEA